MSVSDSIEKLISSKTSGTIVPNGDHEI